ncbi:MAG: CapA family protein [Lachnospiraceae bacterium]|nr:CapA family protein [Lachnospiraceae bacterium]
MKRSLLILGCMLGSAFLLTGCGDDVEAMVPEAGFVYVEAESVGGEQALVQPTERPAAGAVEAEPIGTKVPTEEVPAEPIGTPIPAATQKPIPTEAPKTEVVTVTISAAGDCSLGNHQEQEYNCSFIQAYDKEGGAEYFLRNVKDIFAADDLTIVNLEGVLTTSNEAQAGRTYNIKGDPSYAKILTEGSVEMVSMANNHRLDYGLGGTADTEDALEAEGIAYAYDTNVTVYETKGIRIGFVSVNEVAWGLGTETLVKEGIDKLRAMETPVNMIIVACHWGIEKDNYPEAYQLELGKKCIDMGADLVLGHHPHVLQGIEEYNGKLIVHSLGNFSFGANRNPADKDTMIFQQTFTFVDGVKQEDVAAKVIPCTVSSISHRNNFQPTPLEGDEAVRVIGRLNEYSAELGVMVAEDGVVQVAEQ